MADAGFPRGGGANSPGAPTYDFAKFSQKLHENERIWTPGGGGASLVPPLDPPLKMYVAPPYPSRRILDLPRCIHEFIDTYLTCLTK